MIVHGVFFVGREEPSFLSFSFYKGSGVSYILAIEVYSLLALAVLKMKTQHCVLQSVAVLQAFRGDMSENFDVSVT